MVLVWFGLNKCFDETSDRSSHESSIPQGNMSISIIIITQIYC